MVLGVSEFWGTDDSELWWSFHYTGSQLELFAVMELLSANIIELDFSDVQQSPSWMEELHTWSLITWDK